MTDLINPIELSIKATEIARKLEQVVGDKNDYYVTLWQLDKIISSLMP